MILKTKNLHIRWLGKSSYEDVWALQQALYSSDRNYLLLVEHPPTYTLGVRAKQAHLLKSRDQFRQMGAEMIEVDRGGDVTFHGPGQLVGYPILSLASQKGGLVHTAQYICELENLLKEVIEQELGFGSQQNKKIAGKEKFPGLWVETPTQSDAKKIASIGVKLNRGRTMHGFALNVSTDLSWFDHIIPCGIENISMTSLRQQGLDVNVYDAAKAVAKVALRRWIDCNNPNFKDSKEMPDIEEIDTAFAERSKLKTTQPPQLELNARKPEWLRAPVIYSDSHLKLKKILKELPTVCEEAGCPNLFDCWGEGTATFMINGTRCTRSCGFCLVDTQKPLELDETEPDRLASAVENMGLKHVVITAVARDDLADGGSEAFVKTIKAVRKRCPDVDVEVLIPDFKGRLELLEPIFNEQPEVLNHNLETCLRLQKQVRPQAGYARSLSVLARAKQAGLITKSSLMVGLGETIDEIKIALRDLGQVGVDIVTIGQYLRPSKDHLPVNRWVEPEEFQDLADLADFFNISHIEAGPLVRSSYKAGDVKSKLSF